MITSNWAWLSVILLWANLSAAETMPRLRGQSFADTQVDLPSDLHGRLGILVLGFSKKSSVQTRQWNQVLLRDYGSDTDIAYYQCAVLADVPGFVRGMVLRSIRNGMELPERTHFVPILQDAAQWRGAAHFSSADPDDAYILIVGNAGQIEWQARGAETPDAYRRLKDRLAELHKLRDKP